MNGTTTQEANGTTLRHAMTEPQLPATTGNEQAITAALVAAVLEQVRAQTVSQPGIWEQYLKPALPYAATFAAGAGMGVLGAYYFLGDDDDLNA